jgi:hypothetical protein
MLISDSTISFGNMITVTNNSQGGHLLIASMSTSNNAITIGNGALSVNAPLYAPNGTLNLGNGTHAVAFAGQGVVLGNNLVVTYDQGLANANFTSGPSGTWTIEKGSIQEY